MLHLVDGEKEGAGPADEWEWEQGLGLVIGADQKHLGPG